MSLIVCFSGKIGSGKSSVIASVGGRLQWKRTGFGQYLRAEIIRVGGDPDSREALQDMGQRLVESDPDGFCRAVLEFADYRAGENLLVDGIRHVDIFNRLERIVSPAEIRLLHLSVSEDVQRFRVQSRADAADLDRAGAHAVEADLAHSLPDRAHAVVDAEAPFHQVVETCLSYINDWIAS